MTASKGFLHFVDRTLVLIFIITFLMSLGMNSINPIWPLYIMLLGATVIEVSYVLSLSGMVGTILRCPSGIISDRIGRRTVVLISIILAVIPPLFYMQAVGWRELPLWACLYGAAFALFMPTRNAWIADLVEPEEIAKAYSFLNMAFPLGGIIGPVIGGMIVDGLGWNVLFILVAAIHGIGLLPVITIKTAGKTEDTQAQTLEDVRFESGQKWAVILLILLQFLFGFGFGTVMPMIPLYLTERFRCTTTQIGLFTSIGFGVTATLAQIPGARLADRLGEKKLVFYCCLILPFTFLLWPFSTQYLQLLVLRMISTAAWSMTWASTASILMRSVPSSRRGLFAGLAQASIMFGFTVGPTLAGILWEEIGYNAPLYASSLIFTVAIPTALLLTRSKRNS